MKKNEYRLPQPGEFKEPFYMRWPAIILALIFLWPVGLMLLITKIIGIVRKARAAKPKKDAYVPYVKLKSKQAAADYLRLKKQQGKRVTTTLLFSFLMILLGCLGITKDYLSVFYGGYVLQKLIMDFVCHVLFLMVGVYMSSRAIALLTQSIRVSHILTALNGCRSCSLQTLSEKSGYGTAQLKVDLLFMIDQLYFAEEAELDMEADILYCWVETP